MFNQRYNSGSTRVTSNLPFDKWAEVFGSERLTGALPDHLTHPVNILEKNGDSYRLNQSRSKNSNKDPTRLNLRVGQPATLSAASHQVDWLYSALVDCIYSAVDNPPCSQLLLFRLVMSGTILPMA